MGEVGVVTWEGFDTYPRDGSVEGMYYNLQQIKLIFFA